MARQPRTLAFDDGIHHRGDARAALVGILVRGAQEMEAAVVGEVAVDGFDATEAVIALARRLPGAGPDLVLIDGIALAGLNLVSLDVVARTLHRPVVAVTRRAPDRAALVRALAGLPDAAARLAALARGHAVPVTVGDARFYAHGTGPDGADLDGATLERLLAPTMAHAGIPEPLRLAHLIATAVSRGASGTPA